MDTRILKGTIVFSPSIDELKIHEDSYIVVKNGRVLEILEDFDRLDKSMEDTKVEDYTGKLIIPGFTDLHLHASQYPNRGLGLDKELLPWLESYTFPEENRYKDLEYAKKVFKKLVNELWSIGTLRSVVFSSIHKESTELLFDIFIESGLGAYIGKVNMDRNAAEYLTEDVDESIEDTEAILTKYIDKSTLVRPIITPRFAPSCSDELMEKLGRLPEKYNIPVQSHLNENLSEIEWVRDLFSTCENYSSVYDKFNLFGPSTVMAHCIYNKDEEIELMAERGVYAAHCPSSNYNLASGIMPVRKYLDKGVNIGLASDIAGGSSLSIAFLIVQAIQASKMLWLYSDKKLEPLSFNEAFYLATKGGGSFFGRVGSFEEGYEFDALLIDDSKLSDMRELTVKERLQRYIYIGDDRQILARYVRGKEIKKPFDME